MLTVRYSAVCVLLAALFAAVVLCATDVCGEYSAGVPRGGGVDAHGPMHIYAAEKKRWQMRAMLQGGVAPTKEDSLKKEVPDVKVKSPVEDDLGKVGAKAERNEKTDPVAPAPVEKHSVTDTEKDKSTEGFKGTKAAEGQDEGTVASSPVKGQDGEEDQTLKGGKGEGPEVPPVAKEVEKTAAGEGGKQSEKEVVPSPPVVPEQPKEQGTGGEASKTGETKKKEGTTTASLSKKDSESDTETADFAALVRAPLVFFLLLVALACVCVC